MHINLRLTTELSFNKDNRVTNLLKLIIFNMATSKIIPKLVVIL